jgi:hypothetical protein
VALQKFTVPLVKALPLAVTAAVNVTALPELTVVAGLSVNVVAVVAWFTTMVAVTCGAAA